MITIFKIEIDHMLPIAGAVWAGTWYQRDIAVASQIVSSKAESAVMVRHTVIEINVIVPVALRVHATGHTSIKIALVKHPSCIYAVELCVCRDHFQGYGSTAAAETANFNYLATCWHHLQHLSILQHMLRRHYGRVLRVKEEFAIAIVFYERHCVDIIHLEHAVSNRGLARVGVTDLHHLHVVHLYYSIGHVRIPQWLCCSVTGNSTVVINSSAKSCPNKFTIALRVCSFLRCCRQYRS